MNHKVGYIRSPPASRLPRRLLRGKSPTLERGISTSQVIDREEYTMRSSKAGHYVIPVLVHSATSTGSFFRSYANDKGLP